MSATPSSFPSPSVRLVASDLALFHRGFQLAVRATPGRFGAHSFGFTIRHCGNVLHQSDGAFGSAETADRAARRFIDDALGAFDHATHQLDATC